MVTRGCLMQSLRVPGAAPAVEAPAHEPTPT